MAGVRLEQVTKVFPDGTRAVDAVDLEIRDGEFMVLVGPVRLREVDAAAARRRSRGGDRRADRCSATATSRVALERDRDMAMVFQNYALYPHMSVRENLAFGLRLRRMPKPERARRVDEVAGTLGLERLLDRKPAALSGGQRQRVAMGRAMVREPSAFLMDEPLSNLDAKLRVAMRAELVRLHERLGVTTVYVTHDQVEAMTLGHRVAVMRDGGVQQCAAPEELYDQPAEPVRRGLHRLAGDEPRRGDGRRRRAAVRRPRRCRCPPRADAAARAAIRVVLGMRPSDLALAGAHADPAAARLRVLAEVVERLGLRAARDLRRRRAAGRDRRRGRGVRRARRRRRRACSPTSGRSLFTAVLDGRAPVAVDDDARADGRRRPALPLRPRDGPGPAPCPRSRRAVSAVVVTGAALGLGRAVARASSPRRGSLVGLDRRRGGAGGRRARARRPRSRPSPATSATGTRTSAPPTRRQAAGGLAGWVNNAGDRRPGRRARGDAGGDRRRPAGAPARSDVRHGGGRPAPARAAGRGGSIVNVGSIQGVVAFPGYFVYQAAKAAVAMISRGVAVDYGDRGIRCNAVLPGTLDTPMTAATVARRAALGGRRRARAARPGRAAGGGRGADRLPALRARELRDRRGHPRRRRRDGALLPLPVAGQRGDATRGSRTAARARPSTPGPPRSPRARPR